ncbi:hypothetical protein MSIMFI_00963 [Mycobacterium simulans]|nr:hypothetical protein MSIMFI_00963 [Mycobacterium simulans]
MSEQHIMDGARRTTHLGRKCRCDIVVADHATPGVVGVGAAYTLVTGMSPLTKGVVKHEFSGRTWSAQ